MLRRLDPRDGAHNSQPASKPTGKNQVPQSLTKYKGETETERLASELDEAFKPITVTDFHQVPDRTEPSTGTPTSDDVGINLLNKNLRDITGVLHDTKHFLTHEADTMKGNKLPCEVCKKAARRQKRKYSEKTERIRKGMVTAM